MVLQEKVPHLGVTAMLHSLCVYSSSSRSGRIIWQVIWRS